MIYKNCSDRTKNLQTSIFENEEPRGNTFYEICSTLHCDNQMPAWPDIFGRKLFEYLSNNQIQINTLSLFTGAGGLDIGFNDAGFNIVESVEIEKKFCSTLKMNSGEGRYFSHSKVSCIDIKDYTPDHLPKIDFIIGGPPCQTFSAAGRRANGVLGTTDARGILFREYVRLLRELSPQGFLFENVYGIIGAQNGEAWQEILLEFSNAGYKLFYRIIDVADYGVPQHRERLIIVGLKDKAFKFPRPTHGPDSIDGMDFYTAEQAISGIKLEDSEAVSGINGRYGYLLNDIPPGLNYSFYTKEMGHPNPVFAWRSKFSDFLYKADPKLPVRTIKAQGGQYTGPFHWDNRRFTLSEFKRLQTFPDEYLINGNRQAQIQQIGNSVPPQVARILAMAIRNQVFGTNFPFEIPYLEENEKLSFRKRKRQLTDVYQSKAKIAIDSTENQKKLNIPDSHSYNVNISKNFAYKKSITDIAEYNIKVVWSKDLIIDVTSLRYTFENSQKPVFSISVKPSMEGWDIGVREIFVQCYSQNKLAYTVAWKAIEEELISNGIKADLVQLCGYYQYASKISCCLSYNSSDYFFNVLEKVVNGDSIGRLLSEEELSRIWDIPINEIMSYAIKMREIGYEIRNNKTNPQIEVGQWLIPYAFPTLTPLSVQLRKKLR